MVHCVDRKSAAPSTCSHLTSVTTHGRNIKKDDIVICPIAIAYSMGQIIKSVCVCVCVCVCLSVCPSVGTLTVAFLDRFSPKLAQT